MDFSPYLRERNLKVTPQRMSILKILDQHTHPTVEELLEKIRRDFPSVSTSTIYKNLNILKEMNMIIEISTQIGRSRLDIYIRPHAHIICKNCGAIEDIDFTDSTHMCKKEFEDNSSYEITKLNITATVDSCRHCREIDLEALNIFK
ncbi:MAG: transcriptional repressor [Campylobacteraceae bacterium]|jgi:Fur family peroxide stress response transcriptional regulator|nr:transcriptional repressor [Campylobacteraceae bacterium]